MTHNPVKNAWLEVGDELESIGLKLKLHLEQQSSEDDVDDEDAWRRLSDRIEVAVAAIEHAADDDAVRSDLRETGQKLVDAMSTTCREALRAARRHAS